MLSVHHLHISATQVGRAFERRRHSSLSLCVIVCHSTSSNNAKHQISSWRIRRNLISPKLALSVAAGGRREQPSISSSQGVQHMRAKFRRALNQRPRGAMPAAVAGREGAAAPRAPPPASIEKRRAESIRLAQELRPAAAD